ncbi:hypothetical protein GCM10025857_17380 [Alicyclobacillus contaminans]|uniref:tRNA (adenosine(37)-N6)-threonylcarbamoyltransferase complex dimerization subunit type 1 TsaB n=1 Tax=Alicyclobacillus contaminans TaxID=392016 RepID=UPI0004076D30|nr:tRNA (adenosine(37)-N6)-threonylcarbamoyltransferase complex dimerization subunit type 1 TsaB [Alicyclobacillus contaminans]GMA50381.1 hypothetical protein GCM10025857_17380 [Alicyclobacillus contaminans]
MAVLTLDTATQVASVAVGQGTSLLATMTSLVPRGHSRVLQPAVAAVLNAAGLQPTELTRIVVGIGPGSYTGVRLAVATAKALASALAVPLTPVSTLMAMAEAVVPDAGAGQAVLPLLYARRKRAFGALYLRADDGTWQALQPPEVRSVSAWAALCQGLSDEGRIDTGGLTIVHDFEPKHQVLELLPSARDLRLLQQVASELAPALFRLSYTQTLPLLTGDAVHELVPDYALPVEAEVRLTEREGNQP